VLARRLLALLLVALCAFLAGCGGDDEDGDAESAGTTEATETAPAEGGGGGGSDAEGCESVAKPEPKPDGGQTAPTEDLDASKTWRVVVVTNCGDFTITLDPETAPKTTASFVELARNDFYDDTTFHRIVPGFVIQGGDPLGSGLGGPGYSTVDAPPSDAQYVKNVVSMAKAGNEAPGTSGSQFFVVTGENIGLPPDYAIIGEVTAGQDVVERIGLLGDPNTELPTQPVVIEDMEVEEG
jgi:cyclophilin family peptidyl-prolyl cis-trans isomerase